MKKAELKQNRKYALLASTLLFSAGILGMGVTPPQINADVSNVAESSKQNTATTAKTVKATSESGKTKVADSSSNSEAAQGTFKQTSEYQDEAGKSIASSDSVSLKAGEKYSLNAPKTIAGYKVNYAKSSYTITNEDGTNSGSLAKLAANVGVTSDPSSWTTADWQKVLDAFNATTVSENGVGKDYSVTLTYKYDAEAPKGTLNQKTEYQNEAGNTIADSDTTALKAGESYSLSGPKNISGYQVNKDKSSYTIVNESGTHKGSLTELAAAAGIDTSKSWTINDLVAILNKDTVSANAVGKDYSITLTYKYDAEAPKGMLNQKTEYQNEAGNTIADSDTTALKAGESYSLSTPKNISGYQVNKDKSSYTIINESGTHKGSLTELAAAAGIDTSKSWTINDLVAILNKDTVSANAVGKGYAITLTYKYDAEAPKGTFNETSEYQNEAGKTLAKSDSEALKAGEKYSLHTPKQIAGYQINYSKSTFTLINEDGTHTGSLAEFAANVGVTGNPNTWTSADWQKVLDVFNNTTVSENGVGKGYAITLTYKYTAIKPTISVKPKITIKKGSNFKLQDLFNSIVSSTGTKLNYAEAIANGSLTVTGPNNFNTNKVGNKGTYTFTYTDPVTGLSVTATGVVIIVADGTPGKPGEPTTPKPTPGDNDGSGDKEGSGNGETDSNSGQSGNQGNGLSQGNNGKETSQIPSANGQTVSGATKNSPKSVSANKELPQTDEANSIAGRNIGLIGLFLMATLALFGVVRRKRY
ncbi:hypothetical protein AH70_07575 [Pediococcus damnosus LMG 28219]|uniref:MucBP domain-containing protein n=2 Tax=Pediococcus damnosus TaxID=51663 RepID=UPI00061EC14F|nr:MucBP domain-containing protein [Pediococcus damnosus]AMV60772.1 putative cell-wall-anchored protein SasA (LPXTG motif) [Pediococcus damnosus]AMV65083.1 putative cell-wall-anchored protein SasA (LPXTG motif) [Pediococcus damnosus]KJU74315.1 hypothetical protein AH70_07575 [Pediococcus damnosus LMG 28219]PIO81598.1 hypothetical protein BSQ38_08025 [Pediococcus damnosus]